MNKDMVLKLKTGAEIVNDIFFQLFDDFLQKKFHENLEVAYVIALCTVQRTSFETLAEKLDESATKAHSFSFS